MSNPADDKAKALERIASEQARNAAGIAWREGKYSEQYRVIRGQSVGIQSGGVILLDHIVPLAAGLDPSGGNAAAQIAVFNTLAQTFADFEIVDAIYNPDVVPNVADWETLKSVSGSSNYTIIRGLAYTDVAAEDPTFYIDNIILLAGSLDPRSTPGSLSEILLLINSQFETFYENEIVTAIYDGSAWITLPIERFRAIRGVYYSTPDAAHVVIDHIEPLDSGLDPRTSIPYAVTDQLSLVKEPGQTYVAGDVIKGDFNCVTKLWEARPQGTSEQYRAIRGLTTAASAAATATFTINTVFALDRGLLPAVPTTIRNIPLQAHGAGEKVWADWNQTDSAWDARPSGSGDEKYRVISGKCVSAVTSGTATFTINNVHVIAGGLDPRTVPGSTTEAVTIRNSQPEYFYANEVVVAVYDNTLDDWVTLVAERFRRIRGTCHGAVLTTDATFLLDNIEALESGLDPRSSPDSSGYVTIKNTPAESHIDGAEIFAYFKAKTNEWVAEPKLKEPPPSGIFTCHPTAPVSAGTAAAPTAGTGDVYSVADDGSTTSVATAATIRNPFKYAITSDCTVRQLGTSYLIVGAMPPLVCDTKTVVTDTGCVFNEETEEYEMTQTTESITYLSEPCP